MEYHEAEFREYSRKGIIKNTE
jgi:hypothetical protein